jgi:septal ring factor EnvC (AmiA/AmiB activator)
MATSTPPHASLVRAAAAEEERVDRALQRLSHRRDTLAAELSDLESQMGELHERRRLLAMLVEGPEAAEGATSAPVAPGPRAGVTAVRGRQLRRVAAQLLWQTSGDGEVHYREWFERLLAAGYAVGGRDPLASFLTNVRDSPAVVRGAQPGFYRLDPSRLGAIEAQIDEQAAALEDLEHALADARATGDDARVETLRADRRALTAERKRLEAQAEELATVFGDDADADVRL